MVRLVLSALLVSLQLVDQLLVLLVQLEPSQLLALLHVPTVLQAVLSVAMPRLAQSATLDSAYLETHVISVLSDSFQVAELLVVKHVPLELSQLLVLPLVPTVLQDVLLVAMLQLAQSAILDSDFQDLPVPSVTRVNSRPEGLTIVTLAQPERSQLLVPLLVLLVLQDAVSVVTPPPVPNANKDMVFQVPLVPNAHSTLSRLGELALALIALPAPTLEQELLLVMIVLLDVKTVTAPPTVALASRVMDSLAILVLNVQQTSSQLEEIAHVKTAPPTNSQLLLHLHA